MLACPPQLHPYARIPSTIPSSVRKITSRGTHDTSPPCPRRVGAPQVRTCGPRRRRAFAHKSLNPVPSSLLPYAAAIHQSLPQEGTRARQRLRQCMAGLTFGPTSARAPPHGFTIHSACLCVTATKEEATKHELDRVSCQP
uniref:Uncharacterized protein n=1 Tax=Arundo donax TaxID=35708 RepID=A0A0A9GPX7_ARUDO